MIAYGKPGKKADCHLLTNLPKVPFIPEFVPLRGYSLTFSACVIAQPLTKINGVRTDLAENFKVFISDNEVYMGLRRQRTGRAAEYGDPSGCFILAGIAHAKWSGLAACSVVIGKQVLGGTLIGTYHIDDL